MRLPVNHVLPLAALLLACGSGEAGAKPAPAGAAPANSGPAADYPVTIGDPFTVDGTTWTPADQLNYDAVGYAAVEAALGAGVAGAHKTLPLPSYVEVTALDSGRTILVRLVERGPMANDTLLALSPVAAEQLGLTPGVRSAVRMRRVNPPEVERAALRSGGIAPLRMETPESLLKVLRRRLADRTPLLLSPSPPAAAPQLPPQSAPVLPGAAQAAPVPPATKGPSPKPTPAPRPKASPAAATGNLVIQVAAFSTSARAEKVAAQLGGRVSRSGAYWRVRLGPYKSKAEASPVLEKAKAAGYSDARIQRAD